MTISEILRELEGLVRKHPDTEFWHPDYLCACARHVPALIAEIKAQRERIEGLEAERDAHVCGESFVMDWGRARELSRKLKEKYPDLE